MAKNNEKQLTEKRNKGSIKFLDNVIKYFTQVISEAKKVNWPTRKTTLNLTLLVLAISIIISLLVALLDFIFNKITLGF